MMKYLKIFENFKKYKGTILYHGTPKPHEIKGGHFSVVMKYSH